MANNPKGQLYRSYGSVYLNGLGVVKGTSEGGWTAILGQFASQGTTRILAIESLKMIINAELDMVMKDLLEYGDDDPAPEKEE